MAWSRAGASWWLMSVLAWGVVLYAAIAYAFLPLGASVHPDMRAAFEAHPVGIAVHVSGSIFALTLGPFQFVESLRANHLRLHRWIGRLYLGAGVLIGGLAGLYMSQFAFGGPLGQLGFGALALAWLYTGARAYDAIRRREIAQHRRWMIRNFALAYAAVMLRLYLSAAVISGADFAIAYGVIAWACWVPNLFLAEWLIRRNAGRLPQAA